MGFKEYSYNSFSRKEGFTQMIIYINKNIIFPFLQDSLHTMYSKIKCMHLLGHILEGKSFSKNLHNIINLTRHSELVEYLRVQ